MELKYYLDKAIDEYLSTMGSITSKKIMNYVYSEYNLDAKIEEINNILNMSKSMLEIVDGIFVDKNLFLSFVKGKDIHALKSQIEFQYLISINEEQVVKILDVIELHDYQELQCLKEIKTESINEDILTSKITKEENYELEGEKITFECTYSKLIDFGMEHGYIKSGWVLNIDYNLEKEVYDYFEAIEEMEEKGIKIKY